MRAFLAISVIAGFGLLAVMALVFRSESARHLLKFGRNALWIYIAVIFGLALVQFYREGL
ncbi:MAG: hypothetical protein ABIP13_10290 [Tepidiformaceae bacterium]